MNLIQFITALERMTVGLRPEDVQIHILTDLERAISRNVNTMGLTTAEHEGVEELVIILASEDLRNSPYYSANETVNIDADN